MLDKVESNSECRLMVSFVDIGHRHKEAADHPKSSSWG